MPSGSAPGTVARATGAGYLAEGLSGRKITLGSRTSPMAMAQARMVAGLLGELLPGTEVDIDPIETSADQWSGDLSALGGKGAFIKEIDRALLMGKVDVAVHCMKDVPGDIPLPPGLVFAAYLPRDDVRDCVVFPATSPYRIGSSSVRRKAQLGRLRPHYSSVSWDSPWTPSVIRPGPRGLSLGFPRPGWPRARSSGPMGGSTG